MAVNWKLLEKRYFDPSNASSFSNPKSFFDTVHKNHNVTLNEIKNWLQSKNAYTLFKRTVHRFPRLKTLTNHVDEQWQADLLDISWYAEHNSDTKYLLVVIDLFSRYAWAQPIKNKSGETVSKAMHKILKKRRPEKLQTDQGKEFKNHHFKKLMNDYNINFFTTTDAAVKCAIVERFNRTLRSRIYRYMYHYNTFKYVNKLQSILNGYNASVHRSIKIAPKDVNSENEATIALHQREIPRVVKDKHKDVEYVRLAIKKNLFDKGSTKNWTSEVFQIVERKKTPTTYIYRLKDLNGEDITSIFYPDELNPVVNIKHK